MIAALYVETGGVYYGLHDVDPWDEARDARLYAGPWPVVAHPPCRSWSIMGQCRPEIVRGEDSGCFAAALLAVRRWGGVLEHPAHSHAWKTFGLPLPPLAGWGASLLTDGWTCAVDQRWYGHEARKPTWLYASGIDLQELTWEASPAGSNSVGRSGGRGDGFWRSRTPPAFRDVLLDMARSASRADARGLTTEERTGASSC